MEAGPTQAEASELRERLELLEFRMAEIESAREQAARMQDTRPPDCDRGTGQPPDAVPAAAEDGFRVLAALREQAVDPGALLFAGTVVLPTGARYEWQQARSADAVLDHDWSDLAAGLAALGHPVRLLLLHEVLAGRRTVAELSAHERLGTTGQLYHHLRQLVSAGWLRAGARGRYEVPAERVVPLLIVLAAAWP